MSRAESCVHVAAAWLVLGSSFIIDSCFVESVSRPIRVERALPRASTIEAGYAITEGNYDLESSAVNGSADEAIDRLGGPGVARIIDIGAIGPEVVTCASVSRRSSRVRLLEVVRLHEPQYDADSNGLLDAQDLELNVVLGTPPPRVC